jgi:hypothetical protein
VRCGPSRVRAGQGLAGMPSAHFLVVGAAALAAPAAVGYCPAAAS